jgi:hypothetical protein
MKFFSLVLLLIGFGVGCASFYIVVENTQKMQNGHQVTGKVVSFERERSITKKNRRGSLFFYPVFQYEFKGKTYAERSSTGSNPPAFNIGDTSTLYLDPQFPEVFLIDSFMDKWLFSIVLGFFAFAFGGAGLAAAIYVFKRNQIRKWLHANGTAINAKITYAGINNSKIINGKRPYIIEAQWHNSMDNKIYTFKSDDLWFDPSPYVSSEIEVLIDRRNPKDHQMMLNKIPQAA